MSKTKLKILDLFSGTGGFTLGLESTGGFEVSSFCEIEKPSQLVLGKHWPHVPVITDITDHDFSVFKGKIDVITGGFPCTDISIAKQNAKGLSGEKSGLWHAYKDVIDEVRPKYVLIENVFALQKRGLDTILANLASIGYDATWTMFDSQYFGVPQRRRRLYIVGFRDGISADLDFFEHSKRTGEAATKKIKDFKESRTGDIQQRKEGGKDLTYFTRQRSDQFDEIGVAATITKRDYKSFTDLVVHLDGTVRKVVPKERLRLQGYPSDYFDGLGISRTEQYRMNGMTQPVIKYIGERLLEAEKW